MSVKHLQPFADQLTFSPQTAMSGKAHKSAEGDVTKSPTVAARSRLRLMVSNA
jgi:hypothetical protein